MGPAYLCRISVLEVVVMNHHFGHFPYHPSSLGGLGRPEIPVRTVSPDFERDFGHEVGMSKHSAAKRRARKEKCPGFLAEHVQPDPSQLSRQLGASSQAVLHLPTGAGASLGHSGARGHTTQCFNL